jgi:hypothetical protein
VTRTLKLADPGGEGVPEMTPVLLLRLRPAGKAPVATDQIRGAVPPVLLTE